MKSKLLFLLLISFTLSQNSIYVVVNLDEKTSGQDYSQLSNSLQTFVSGNLGTYSLSDNPPLQGTPLKFDKEKTASFTFNETYSVIINTLQFLKEGAELSNYEVTSYIGGNIIPHNYYSGHTSLGDSLIDCAYINNSPSYLNKSLSFKVKSVVNSKRYNFALNENDNIVIFEIDNSEIEVKNNSTFSTYYKPTDEKNFDTTKFSKLFMPRPSFISDSYKVLIAIQSDNKIYTFKIQEREGSDLVIEDEANFQITNSVTINAVSLNNNYYYIATSDGIYKYIRTGGTSSKITSSNGFAIKDIIVNKNTLYAITNKGMHIMDIETEQFDTTPYLPHQYLEKFDYVLYEKNDITSTYFVGIIVNNQPTLKVPEVIIELIANSDMEFYPKVNKVFMTNTSIDIKDVATDPKTYYSYIYDRTTKKLYVVTRSVPNFQDSFSYILDLSNDIIEGTNEDDYLSFVSFEDNEDEQILAIQTQTTVHLVGRVTRYTQALTCLFKNVGEYSQIFTSGVDCSSKNEAGIYQLKGCQQSYVFPVEVTEKKGKRTGLWVAVAIGIVVIIGIILGTLCFVFKKKIPVREMQVQDGVSFNNQEIKKGHYSKPSSEMAVVPVEKPPVLDNV